MSDDLTNGAYHANQGITLPGTNNATHNIKLAPLFLELNGYTILRTHDDWEYVLITRGGNGYFWSNAATTLVRVYYIALGDTSVAPSNYDATLFGLSLRCLVSTTNS